MKAAIKNANPNGASLLLLVCPVYGLPLANSLKNAPPPNTVTPALAWFGVLAFSSWVAALPAFLGVIYGSLGAYIKAISADYERVTGHIKEDATAATGKRD